MALHNPLEDQKRRDKESVTNKATRAAGLAPDPLVSDKEHLAAIRLEVRRKQLK